MGAGQILFIQGGGASAHDVHYPRMPAEDDSSYTTWSAAVRRELAILDGCAVVGHSVGGTILIQVLADRPLDPAPEAVALIAAPFVGAGGWPGDEFALSHDLGTRLPPDVRVEVFHGLADRTVPPSHADLYARAIPQAHLHLLPGRDNQLNNDLAEVAKVIVRQCR